MNKEAAHKIKNDLVQMNKSFSKLEFIGSGNHGYAFKLGNHVIKVTDDSQEAIVAKQLEGRENRHIGNIYSVWKHTFPSREKRLYVIDMELLFTSDIQNMQIQQALSDYKSVWFCRYGGSLRRGLNYWDLCKIYMDNNVSIISHVRDMLSKDILEQNEWYSQILKLDEKDRLKNSLYFFDFIHSVYKELLPVYPNARIDLNDGNFMYDCNGNLKCFDFQQYEI